MGVSIIGHGQAFLGAFSLGANISQIDGDELFGYKKFGLNGSASAIYPFHKNWQTSVEIQFSQKGAYQKYPVELDPTKGLPYYDLRLNYLEVPLLIHFVDKNRVSIGTGIQYGRLVSLKEVEWGEETTTETGQNVYARDDWNALVDIRIPLAHRFKLNFRYHYSLFSIRERDFTDASGREWTRQQYNNFMSIRLIYVFNEPSTEE